MARQTIQHDCSALVGPRTQIVGTLPNVPDPDFAEITIHADNEAVVMVHDQYGHEHFRITLGAGKAIFDLKLYGESVNKAKILACPRPGELARITVRAKIEQYSDSIIDRIGRLNQEVS